jgi:hypothetical protein
MDKKLICGLFGHFLTGGNWGFWAETGVSVQCGRGFCREGWETLREHDETGKHPERNLSAVIKVLVNSDMNRLPAEYYSNPTASSITVGTGGRNWSITIRHRDIDKENNMTMIWRHRITLTAVLWFHSDSCNACFILGNTYGILTRRKRMHPNA